MFSNVSKIIGCCQLQVVLVQRLLFYSYIGFAWAKLMKTKTALESVEKFKEILSTVDVYPLQLVADKGGEWKNKLCQKFCIDNGIKLIHAETFKAAFIERYVFDLNLNFMKEGTTAFYIFQLQSHSTVHYP